MKRRAGAQVGTPRKRGRKKANEVGDENNDEMTQQMRRQMILQGGNDDEEEWMDYQEEGGQMLEDIYIPPKITRTEHPCTGERLVIEKIVCENFKSYGGLKEMGPFHKSFSAIIGPNGNGKSNIIDAMLFVFGYRASKIRCKKVATLIHKSELLPNLTGCAVTVHFVKIIDEGEANTNEDYKIVENSRITVTRRAFADNSSKYKLDGKTVKFQDVARFLKANGIDIVHNRFLILQGEVEQIAQMPPISPPNGDTGLLEFLEEVIGTKRYIKPLAQLDERVEKLDYERDEKLQRVNVAEKDKEKLAEPVKKAKEYLRDQNSKMKYESFLFQKQAFQAQLKLTEKEETRVKVHEKLQEVQEKLDAILEKSNARKKEFQDAEKIYKNAQKQYDKVKKKFDAADAEFIQLNQELQRTNETRKKQQKEIGNLEKEIERLELIPEGNKRDIEMLTKRKTELIADIEKEESSVQGDLERLNVKVEEALKNKEVADKEFEKLKEVRDAKKSTFDKLQKELNNYKEREAVEKRKLEEQEAELEKVKTAIQNKEKEGRTSIGSGAKKTEGLEKKHGELLKQIQTLAETERGKRAIMEKALGEYQNAQESMDGNSQLDKVDRALFEAKADGLFPGLYGRLKNLAKIPEKYNVAATVSNNQLEYWITDNENTASECIGYLREQKLHVQTFVCLARLGTFAQQANERFDTPARSHRLFDLLEISSPDLIPAYYKAFRNTLVADNIDIATNISYGGTRRHRVITLDGQIVETTGSMVGGGNARIYGKFNTNKSGVSVTKAQLTALKQKYEVALQEHQQAQEARQGAEEAARAIRQQIVEIERKITNFNSDMSALKTQLPLKAANVENQRKKVQESSITPKLLKEKETALSSAEREYQTSLEPYEEGEEKVAKLGEKVKEFQVTKKKEITKKLDKFKDQRKKVDEELNKKLVELKNCETNKKKAEKKLETTRREIELLKNNMEKINERRKKVEQEAKEIKESETELNSTVEETKKSFEELKTHSHEFQQEENNLSKQKLSLENQHSDAANAVKACHHGLKQLKDALKNIKLHEIPEEEVEPLKDLDEAELQAVSQQEIERKVKKYTERLASRPVPNLNVLEEYKLRVNQLFQRIKELDEITKSRDMFREAYCKLDQQRSTEFMEGFALISSRLKEMFRMISMGGDAELEVVDILDLFGCGIQFSVRPARKTWKKISNLSGGEKTLASLSLVFALHHFKPSPFYVMDEIDAALDFKNVSIIANYIKDRTKFTQFIIISLRSNMFELADSLLGVYKVDNMSYSIHLGVRKLLQYLRSKNPALQSQNTNALPSQQTTQPQSNGSTAIPPTATTNDKPEFADLSDIPAASDEESLNVTVRSRHAEEAAADRTVIEQEVPRAGSSSSAAAQQTQSTEKISEQSAGRTVSTEKITTGSEGKTVSTARVTDSIEGSRMEPEPTLGSQDMFESSSDEDKPVRKKLRNDPIATSTPFVGRRVSNYDDTESPAPTGQEDIGLEISPIKSARGDVPRVEEDEDSEDFVSAEDD